MISKLHNPFSRKACGLIALAIGAAVLPLRAQTAPEQSSAQPSMAGPAPLLEQLSRETQALHDYVAASLVRVHVPDRFNSETGPAEELLRKWEQRLEPAVRQKLIEQSQAHASQSAIGQDPYAAVRDTIDRLNGQVLVVRPFDATDPNEPMLGFVNPQRPHAMLPGTLGIVMDDHGLVLVPAFIEHDLGTQHPLRVTLPQGGAAEAVFVGSDKQTGLTLVRLAIPTGRPAILATVRPEEGSLVMTFATQNDAARLTIWTASGHDAGVVVTPDGRVAGFANANQFLAAPCAEPVIHQLADHGECRRPFFGIHVTEIHRDDPGRPQVAGLGGKPALHVDQVVPGSPADQSGVHPGDLILTLAGEPVGDVPSFAAMVSTQTGHSDLQILRGGQVIPFTLTLP